MLANLLYNQTISLIIRGQPKNMAIGVLDVKQIGEDTVITLRFTLFPVCHRYFYGDYQGGILSG